MKSASTKAVIMAALFTILLQPGSPARAQVYQWEDEQGMLNLTDNLEKVPEKYRDRATEIILPKDEGRPGENAPSPPGGPKETIKEQADLQGRSREWWQGRAREWREKKSRAAQELALAKERLNTIPMSLPFPAREREKQEILREMGTYEGQVREAERILNEVLPEEARKAGAPPGWVRE